MELLLVSRCVVLVVAALCSSCCFHTSEAAWLGASSQASSDRRQLALIPEVEARPGEVVGQRTTTLQPQSADSATGAATVAAAARSPKRQHSLGPWPKQPVCLHQCSGHGSCSLAGQCDCYVGYFGSACEHQTRHFLPRDGAGGLFNLTFAGASGSPAGSGGECPNDCSNRGFCDSEARVCHCDPGFHGDQCEHDLCPASCSGHGTCLADGCRCHDGYVGIDCASKSCPQDCSRHGYCGNGTCFCFPGYTGPACGVSHCPGSNRTVTCSGHGACVPGRGSSGSSTGVDSAASSAANASASSSSPAATAEGTCECEPGYFGPGCEVQLCGPKDQATPADAGTTLCHLAHGHCVQKSGNSSQAQATTPRNKRSTTGNTSSSCECRHGYSGRDCTIPPKGCPSDCLSRPGGRCETGGVCSTECDRKCSENGICRNSTCLCKDGYGGQWCEDKICATPCKHGTCDGRTGTCVCDAGFESPPDCQRALCQHACSGHGVCEEHGLLPHHGLCVCRRGWGGRFCERLSCPRGCWRNGKCVEGALPDGSRGGVCQCATGFTGSDCSAHTCSVPALASGGAVACSGHGQCQVDARASSSAGARSGRAPTEIMLVAPDHASGGDSEGAGDTAVVHKQRIDSATSVIRTNQGAPGVTINTTGSSSVLRGAAQGAAQAFLLSSGAAANEATVTIKATASEYHRSSGNSSLSPSDGGSDVGNATGICYCAAGWGGPNCAVRLCESNCNGHGVCTADGSCRCTPEWAGPLCSQRACPGNCSGHGHCNSRPVLWQPGLPYWTVDQVPQVDALKALALLDQFDRRGTGESGGMLPTPSLQNVALQHGGGWHAKVQVCSCEAGWTGNDCARSRKKGGKPGHGVTTIAPRSTTSSGAAEDKSNATTALSHITSEIVQAMTTSTPAPPGSERTANNVTATCNPPCAAWQGVCRGDQCLCRSGWTGPTCADPSCPMACSGHGRCVAGVCACDLGYGGEACVARECPLVEVRDLATLQAAAASSATLRAFGVVTENSTPGSASQLAKAAFTHYHGGAGAGSESGAHRNLGAGLYSAGQGRVASVANAATASVRRCGRHGRCNYDNNTCECNAGWMGPACLQVRVNPICFMQIAGTVSVS